MKTLLAPLLFTFAGLLRHRKPPSQTWRTFLDNHVTELASIDFFTEPTASIRILYVFLGLRHERREVVHLNVTEHPTAQWTAQQMVEAFPCDTAPRYMVRDRDGSERTSVRDITNRQRAMTMPASKIPELLVFRVG